MGRAVVLSGMCCTGDGTIDPSVVRITVGESASSRDPRAQGGQWVSGFLGRSKGVRGELVTGRLDSYVAPVVEVGRKSARDLEWVREQNAKFRASVRGSGNLTQRLSGESDEPEQERPPERPIKGEAFMVKMIEQRMRRRHET